MPQCRFGLVGRHVYCFFPMNIFLLVVLGVLVFEANAEDLCPAVNCDCDAIGKKSVRRPNSNLSKLARLMAVRQLDTALCKARWLCRWLFLRRALLYLPLSQLLYDYINAKL